MDKIEVGDRIRFRSITRWSGAAVWRVVNGFWGSTGQRLKPAELAELLKTAARAAGKTHRAVTDSLAHLSALALTSLSQLRYQILKRH